MKTGKKIIAAGLIALLFGVPVTGCKEPVYTALEGGELTGAYIKWQGRHYYDEEEEAEYFNLSASGFEVRFTGSRLTADLSGDWQNEVVGQGVQNAYLNVFVDEETDPQKAEKIELYDKAVQTYTLVEGLAPGEHTVRIYKCSETTANKAALHRIETDGRLLKAPPKGQFRIEFLGDSVTCGYGISAPGEYGSFATNTEEALQTYAYLTARRFDADFSYLSASGWGMAHGLGADSSVADWFGYADLRTTEAWDTAANKADVVVINLGANDNQYIIGAVDGPVDQAGQNSRLAQYLTTYKNLIETIFEAYGKQTKIICCYGMMRERNLYPHITGMVKELRDAGKTNVTALQLSEGNYNPLALHGHPGLKTNIESADTLAYWIENETSYKLMNDNIVIE